MWLEQDVESCMGDLMTKIRIIGSDEMESDHKYTRTIRCARYWSASPSGIKMSNNCHRFLKYHTSGHNIVFSTGDELTT